MRVLVVTNLWPAEGSFRGVFVREQVEALRSLGHTVDVEVVAQERGRLDYLLAIPRVRRRARAGRYDIVHVHYGLSALAARFTGRTPRILTMHGSDVNVPWQRRMTRLGGGGLAQRIYGSRRLATAMGEPDGHVIPVGVDLTLFTPIDRAEARARLGLDPDATIVLFGARRDNAVKGYDVFSDVLTTLRHRGMAPRELILAEPPRSRPEVPLAFAAADLLLFTSRHGSEGCPAVIKEAVAMGLPVVSVDVGDVAEVLTGVTPSAVVPFPSPWGDEASRRRLVELLADRCADVLSHGGRSNGRDAAGRFDARSIAERVVAVYDLALVV